MCRLSDFASNGASSVRIPGAPTCTPTYKNVIITVYGAKTMIGTANARALRTLRKYTDTIILDQLLLISESSVLSARTIELCSISLSEQDTQHALLRMHIERRQLLCSLMAIQIEDNQEEQLWKMVTNQLSYICQLLRQLVAELQETMNDIDRGLSI